MEKRVFNRLVKQEMLSYGFEKTGTYDYAKEAQDGITKIIIRVPNPEQFFGFSVGVQFKNFEQDYADYSGKLHKTCMSYRYPWDSTLLGSAIKKNYSETDIREAISTVMRGISIFLEKGRDAIYDNIGDWNFGIGNEKKENDIYAYLGMPLIDPYSDSYILKKVEKYKSGEKSMMSLDEYYKHQDHYDKYVEHGCRIDIGNEFVTISYDVYPKQI